MRVSNVRAVHVPGADVFGSWTVVDDKGRPIADVERYIQYLHATNASPQTIKTYARHLAFFFRWLDHRGAQWEDFSFEGLCFFADDLADGTLRSLSHLGPAELTPEEDALGFTEAPYAFGRYSDYSPASGFKHDVFMPVVAELSPVAARRLLLLIEQRVEAALLAASWGLKAPLNETTSKFVRIWGQEEAAREAEQEGKQHRAAEKARRQEAKREERAERRRLDHQNGLARQAKIRRDAANDG